MHIQTQTQYDEAMDELLKDYHPLVVKFIRTQAYERGHSAGYGESYNIACGLASDMTDINLLLNSK